MRWLVAVVFALAAWARPAAAAPALVRAAHVGRVTVLAERGLERDAAQLAEGAERTLTRIAGDLLDAPAPGAIEVRLVRDARDLAAVAPAGRGAPAWAIGVAYPELGVISVALRRDAQVADPQATLRHELAHIALGAALGERAPHWLHEGFAYQHSGEWSWERIETLAGMAWAGAIIPLDQLDRAFPAAEQPAHRAYAESYDFVGFLSRRGRWGEPGDAADRWPFRRFLRELGHGASIDRAAVAAYGKPIHALFDEWRGDLSGRYMLAPIGLLGLAMWVLLALLLAVAWARRRRQNRARLARWEVEERARHAAHDVDPLDAAAAEPMAAEGEAARVVAPPYVAWPGEDPLAAEPDDDDRPPGAPRLMN
jgi:hypothetical protein